MYFQNSAVFPTFGSPTIIILYLRTLSYVKYLSSIIAIYYNYEVVIFLHHFYSNQLGLSPSTVMSSLSGSISIIPFINLSFFNNRDVQSCQYESNLSSQEEAEKLMIF